MQMGISSHFAIHPCKTRGSTRFSLEEWDEKVATGLIGNEYAELTKWCPELKSEFGTFPGS